MESSARLYLVNPAQHSDVSQTYEQISQLHQTLPVEPFSTCLSTVPRLLTVSSGCLRPIGRLTTDFLPLARLLTVSRLRLLTVLRLSAVSCILDVSPSLVDRLC